MDQPARRVARGILLALAVLLLFFAQRIRPRRQMRRDDPSTWPASAQPCVTWFDVEVHQHDIGFSLVRQQHRAGEVRWDWVADGIEGELRLSIWPTAREARETVSRWTALNSFGVWGFSPGGEMVGDVSWSTRTEPSLAGAIYFCRRNVACFLAVGYDRGLPSVEEQRAASSKLLQLGRGIVAAVDRSPEAADPSSVWCPIAELEVPGRLRVGYACIARLLIRGASTSEVRYSCFLRPHSHQGRAGTVPSWSDVELHFSAGKGGWGTLTALVTDTRGMTRRVERRVRIIDDRAPDPTWR